MDGPILDKRLKADMIREIKILAKSYIPEWKPDWAPPQIPAARLPCCLQN